MTEGSVRRRAMSVVFAGAVFVVLTIAAMAAYHGGSRFDYETRHYQFFGNFFSDLGSTVTYSGRANGTARVLFVAALTLVGIALAWSAPVWRTYASRDRALVSARITGVVAVLCGLGFFGIAATSPNSERALHIALVQVAFTLLLVFVVNLVVVQVRNGTPRSLVVVNAAFLVLLAAYVALVIGGPDLNTFAGLRIQIVAQKFAVYASIVNLSVQAWGLVPAAARGRSAHGRSAFTRRAYR